MRDTRAALGLATGLATASTIVRRPGGQVERAPLLHARRTLGRGRGRRIATFVVVGTSRRCPWCYVDDDRDGTPDRCPSVPAADEGMPVESAPTAPRRAERALGTPKTLSAEVASLDNVKRYLVADNPAAALNALAKYHASFPAPMLGPEATVLEVQVLMADGDAGHRARAIALARRFVRMHPTSPHAPQLEMLISKAHEP
jgi:hypothetical protein